MPAIGPYQSVEAVCADIVEGCDPDAVENGCSCIVPRSIDRAEFIRTAGWCAPADKQFECNPGAVGRHLRVILKNSRGLWVSAEGFDDGRMWAGNGDGYVDYAAKKKTIHATNNGFLDAIAVLHSKDCVCCTRTPGEHSPLPICWNIKTHQESSPAWDVTIRCRDDVTGTPWCFRADDIALSAESGVGTHWNGDALVLSPEKAKPPEVVEVWFPPPNAAPTP